MHFETLILDLTRAVVLRLQLDFCVGVHKANRTMATCTYLCSQWLSAALQHLMQHCSV